MQQPPIYLDINNNKSIINALKAGEEYVFDAVYRYYFRRLCAFCSQYVSEQEEIEEIVQDTMMWLWKTAVVLGRAYIENASLYYCQKQSSEPYFPFRDQTKSTSGDYRKIRERIRQS